MPVFRVREQIGKKLNELCISVHSDDGKTMRAITRLEAEDALEDLVTIDNQKAKPLLKELNHQKALKLIKEDFFQHQNLVYKVANGKRHHDEIEEINRKIIQLKEQLY